MSWRTTCLYIANPAVLFLFGMYYAYLRNMIWMEMIRLRTTDSQRGGAMSLLLDSAAYSAGEKGLLQIAIYRSAICATDLGLTLLWDTSFSDPQGSRTGLAISDTLKSFGLVEHSTWVEQKAGGV
jgi:hypothetical protein